MIINKELIKVEEDADYPYIDYTVTRTFLVTEITEDGRIITYEKEEVI